jgi:hypothetical protein
VNRPVAVALACLAAGFGGARAGEQVRHEMTIDLDPTGHHLRITDRIDLPRGTGEGAEFLLNAALAIRDSVPAVRPVELGQVEGFFGINAGESLPDDGVELARYRIAGVPEDGRLILTYEGLIDYGLSDPKEEYTRGFRETAGIIGEEGVYLAGNGFWYPRFGDGLVEFRMEVSQPEGWHLISQGDGSSRGADGRARWDSAGPTDEIYLCGGPLKLYRDSAGAVEALVYLREPDDALAAKYLTATAQYIEMYRELIGPYPYGKFALVENFWETGFGMPSFTLLGPTVIRFPFILHSSYPHEILHNWWGNSVFVDYPSGNWCEGLTAYLADHLVQEQRGRGAEYRRGTLQKYRDYVREGRDFPLSEFRSRHSAATEAVGYGKSLMGFHMLRRLAGDERFREALARFYRDYRHEQASFRDLQAVFEKVTEEELAWFFDPWIERAGAAELRVEVGDVAEVDGGFEIRGSLLQVQGGAPFPLEVPLVVQTAGGEQTSAVRIDEARAPFSLQVEERPLALHVDPSFDLFRLLDPRETPPSLGQLFGEPAILALLPSSAPPDRLGALRTLLDGWRSESHEIECRLDSEIEELPSDRSVWILGRENRFAGPLFGSGEVDGLEPSADGITLGQERAPWDGHSVVAVRRHPDNMEKAVGWLVAGPGEAFPGLGRKLPHYGKYSFLAFEGSEPANVIKGQWGSAGSPLRVDLRPAGDRGEPLPPLPAEKREPLAQLPPVFSERALAEHVSFLASPELEGRGLGGEGLRRAAEYIAGRFEAAGLRPGGDDGGWLQRFTVAQGPDGGPVESFNVVGVLDGGREDWKEQSVVLGAHFDHLGRGWPDVHAGDEGLIHPGADDNASGVAVLLELAANLASGEPPPRSLVFVAFSAEEAGRLGSKAYLERSAPLSREGIRAMINLDTVGRLHDGAITIIGSASAREWPHIFRGCSYVTGVESRNSPEPLDSSDQVSFTERGIPAVQLFTRAHTDYHRPGDTADKVDAAGLVRVATFTKEAIVYLAQREEPLSAVAPSPAEGAPRGPSSGRKVSFGVVPEFSFAGPGVQLADVVPNSPAQRAGLRAGDVLLAVDGKEIAGLREFSELLRGLQPGQSVEAAVRRGEETLTVTVTVAER